MWTLMFFSSKHKIYNHDYEIPRLNMRAFTAQLRSADKTNKINLQLLLLNMFLKRENKKASTYLDFFLQTNPLSTRWSCRRGLLLRWWGWKESSGKVGAWFLTEQNGFLSCAKRSLSRCSHTPLDVTKGLSWTPWTPRVICVLCVLFAATGWVLQTSWKLESSAALVQLRVVSFNIISFQTAGLGHTHTHTQCLNTVPFMCPHTFRLN